MITVIHEFETIAEAKTIEVIKKYFKLKASHSHGKDYFLNRLIFSKKYGIWVKLIDNKQIWQKNHSIIFKKTLVPIE